MTPDEILAYPARVLSQSQRESYFEHGYLLVEGLIDENTIDHLQAVTDSYLNQSRLLSESDAFFDLAPGHCNARPMVRRFKAPDVVDEYWQFANGVVADVSADLLGPNVTFHHSKLNFKWPMKSQSNAVGWHQDVPFYPHTNYNVLAVGTYLTDTWEKDGPIQVIPGSHEGKLYELYDESGNWTGKLKPKDAALLDENRAVSLPGPRGSITIHHGRAVHGSQPSHGENPRPLLINAYVAADAFPYTDGGATLKNYRKIVRGKPASWAHHDPRPCPIPPDWSRGYTSIYEAQSKK